MKIKLRLDDQETRAVWDAAQKAKPEVASWPAWKRGEETTVTNTATTAAATPKPDTTG
jgi:hypothetical protein